MLAAAFTFCPEAREYPVHVEVKNANATMANQTEIPQSKRYSAVRGGRDPGEKTGPLVSMRTTGITLEILLVSDEVGEVENGGDGQPRHRMIFNRHQPH